MIFTQGGNTGGWAFYMKNGKLVAAHNFLDVEYFSVQSTARVSSGSHELKMEFAYEGGKDTGKGGTIELLADGQRIGTGRVERTTPFRYSLSENQDIGSDTGTPVTEDYTPPFAFSGTLEEVVVEIMQ